MPRLRISSGKNPLLIDRLRIYDEHEAKVGQALELVKRGATVACAERTTGISSKTITMRLNCQRTSIRNALESQKTKNSKKYKVSKADADTSRRLSFASSEPLDSTRLGGISFNTNQTRSQSVSSIVSSAVEESSPCNNIRDDLRDNIPGHTHGRRRVTSSSFSGFKSTTTKSKLTKHFLLTTDDPTKLHLTFEEELRISFHLRRMINRNGPFPYQLVAEILRYYVRIRDAYKRVAEQDKEEDDVLSQLASESNEEAVEIDLSKANMMKEFQNETHITASTPPEDSLYFQDTQQNAAANSFHPTDSFTIDISATHDSMMTGTDTTTTTTSSSSTSIPSPAPSACSSPASHQRSSFSAEPCSNPARSTSSTLGAPPSPPDSTAVPLFSLSSTGQQQQQPTALKSKTIATIRPRAFSSPTTAGLPPSTLFRSKFPGLNTKSKLGVSNSLISARISKDSSTLKKSRSPSLSATRRPRFGSNTSPPAFDRPSPIAESIEEESVEDDPKPVSSSRVRSKPRPSIITIPPSYLTNFYKRNGIQSQTIASLCKQNGEISNTITLSSSSNTTNNKTQRGGDSAANSINRAQKNAFVQQKIQTYSNIRSKLVEFEFLQQQKQQVLQRQQCRNSEDGSGSSDIFTIPTDASCSTDNSGLDKIVNTAFASPELYKSMLQNIDTGRVLRLCFLSTHKVADMADAIMDNEEAITTDGSEDETSSSSSSLQSPRISRCSVSSTSSADTCISVESSSLKTLTSLGIKKVANDPETRKIIMDRLVGNLNTDDTELVEVGDFETSIRSRKQSLVRRYSSIPALGGGSSNSNSSSSSSSSSRSSSLPTGSLAGSLDQSDNDNFSIERIRSIINNERGLVNMYLVEPVQVIDAMFDHLNRYI